MSRVTAELFSRLSQNLLTSPRQRRLRRLKRRQQATADRQLHSQADIELEKRALLSAVTIATDLISATDIDLTATDEADASADTFTVNAGITVQSTGSITFNSGDDLLLSDGSSISADTTVNLNLDSGNADAGTGATATLNNSFAGTVVNITGDSDNDAVVAAPSSFLSVPLNINLAGGDANSLEVDLTGVTEPVLTYSSADSGTITSTSHATITFQSVQSVTLGSGSPNFDQIVLDMSATVAGDDGTADTIVAAGGSGVINTSVNGSPFVTIPLAQADELVLSGSGDDDTLQLDHSNGLITVPVTFNGAGGDDLAVVIGDDNESAIYTPDATTTGNGTVAVSNAGTLTFTGLEPVDIMNMSTATLSLPSATNVLTVDAGFDFATGATPAIVVAGTTNGVTIETAAFANNGTVVIDTSTVAGTDTITVNDVNNAHGNDDLTISTGGTATDGDIVNLNGDVIVTGDMTIENAAITLTGDSSINAGGDINFSGGTVDGAFGLMLTTGGTLTLNGTVGGTTPLSTLSVAAGGTTVVGANINTTGGLTISNDATFAPGVTLTGSPVTLQGAASVASGPGQVNVGSNLVLSDRENDDLTLLVSGKTSGGFDQIDVTGTVTLDGDLNLTGIFADTGNAGDEIVLINNDGTDAVIGTFDNFANGAIVTLNGETWRLLYDGGDGNDVVLRFGTGTDVTISDAMVTEGDSGTATLTFTVTSATAIGESFRVTYATADDTATSGSDYTAANSTITFDGTSSGETQTIEISVSGDELVERTETLLLTLTNILDTANATITDGLATGTITDDDSASIKVDGVTLTEGDSGTTDYVFTVSLDANVDVPFTIDYATADVSATVADGDYSATSGTLSFTGVLPDSHTVTVTVNGDTDPEPDEGFQLLISNLSISGRDIFVDPMGGFGEITDDDRIPVELSVSTTTATEADGTVVTLTATAAEAVVGDQTIAIDVTGTGVTAGDYSLTSAMITILDGETTGTVDLTIANDSLVEATEIATISLSGPSGGIRQGTTTSADLTITSDDTASLSIANASATETNSGTTTLTFDVTLDSPVDESFTVDFATADGTASTADSDYVAASDTLTFAGSQGEIQQISIDVTGDQVVELDEIFVVTLSNLMPNGRPISLAQATANGTITNDDSATISIADVTADETDSGTVAFDFVITLTGAVDTGVSVTPATTDDSATVADGDYVAPSTDPIVFAGTNGEQKTFTVTVNGDNFVEANEAFQVMLSNLMAGGRDVTFADDTAVGTITNDDAPVPVNLSASILTGSEANGTMITLTVTADEAVGRDQTVDLVITGVDGTDYTLDETSLTIPDGQTTATAMLTILDDGIVEGIENLVVTLGNPSAGITAGATDSVSIAITDDDTASISIADVTMAEGDSGTTTFEFAVSLTAPVAHAVSMDFATTEDSATATDFTANSGNVEFAALSTETQIISVVVAGDELVELDEEFTVSLSNLAAGGLSVTFADSSATGTITNDDQATLAINDVAVREGDAGNSIFTFNVTLSHAVEGGVTVDYATADGTATAPDDYTAVTDGMLTFTGTAGELQTAQITVIAESDLEVDETFFVNLSNALAGGRDVIIDDAQGQGTIIDDDGIAVNLSSDVSTGTEADSTVITLTATAAIAVSGDQTIDVMVTGDGITTDDYMLSASTITIPDGQTTGTATLTVQNDMVSELDETATVTIGGFPVSLSAGTTTSVDLTLEDNDQTSLSIGNVMITEGDDGTRLATFTVTADNASDHGFTVDYATADDTATVADGDYTAVTTSTLTFNGAAGEQRTFTVEIAGDEKTELDETFDIMLSNVQASGRDIVIGTASATGTIVNDDSATISIGDVTMAEGDSGTTTFNLEVTLTGEVQDGFTVDYSTQDGTAEASTDYTAIVGNRLSFTGTDGEVQTAMISITGDTDAEVNETLSVLLHDLLAGGKAVTMADDTGTATIVDDDGAPVNFAVSATSGTEADETVITLVVSSFTPVVGDQTVDITVMGTGVDSGDYTLSATSITIPDGQSIGTAMFTINDDELVEGTETATLSISNPTAGIVLGATTSQNIEIDSDDEASLSISNVSMNEGDSGTTEYTFEVTLSAETASGFTVDYATADDTATVADGDYDAATGTLTFAGTASELQSFTVTVNGDEDIEPSEMFSVALSNLAGNAAPLDLPGSPATGTILNDDGTAVVNLSATPATASEEAGTTITITATTDIAVVGDQTVMVDLSGAGITSGDYTLSSTSIVIPDGFMTGSVTLTVIDDGQIEAVMETLNIELVSPTTGLTLGTTVTATVMIQDSTVVTLDNIERWPGTQPTLTWQETAGATGYEVWFSRIFPAEAVLEIDRDVTGTSWQVPNELTPGLYRYWVRAKNDTGNFSQWSASQQFEVRPQLIAPVGGSFDRMPTFEWEAVPFAAAYELYLDTSEGVQRIENITGTTYTPAAPLPAGEVRWWIRPEEAIGNRGWSAVGLAGSSVKPVLIAPEGTTSDTTPTFSWAPVPGTGRYVLYVQNTTTSEVLINDANITETSFTPATAMAAGNYRFWVKAIDAATDNFNSGFWSRPLDFSIAQLSPNADDDDGQQGLAIQLVSLQAADAGQPEEVPLPPANREEIQEPAEAHEETAVEATLVALVESSERSDSIADAESQIDDLMATVTDWLL